MITHLHLVGLRLLDPVSLDLSPGLVAITGETGAGKTLLLKAVSLALGAVAEGEIMEQVQEKALLQVVMLTNPGWAEASGLQEGDNPGEVVFTRDLRQGGRSQCKVSGELLPQKKVAEMGAQLLDIHSQDARRLLRDENRQLALFDHWAGADVAKAKNALSVALPRWKKTHDALAELARNQQALERERLELEQSLEDMQRAALGVEEEAAFKRQEQALKSQARLVELLGAALTALQGEEGGAVRLLGEAAKRVGELSVLLAEFEEAAGRLSHLATAATDLGQELRARLEEATEGGLDLDEIQEKLYGHEKLLKRFRVDTVGLAVLRQQYEARLQELSTTLLDPEALAREEKVARAELDKTLKQLCAAREKKRPAFEKAMTTALKELAFNQVRFEVRFAPIEGGQIKKDAGDQRVLFMASFNPGEPARPLGAIASGGEINRVGLALKSVLAAHFDIPCLVFDEVDAGIGGETARAVGRQLAALATDRQVLAITHNHWVAAQAAQHLVVEKRVEKGKTIIALKRLDPGQREDELVRMLGEGGGPAKSARQFARELLKAGSGGNT